MYSSNVLAVRRQSLAVVADLSWEACDVLLDSFLTLIRNVTRPIFFYLAEPLSVLCHQLYIRNVAANVVWKRCDTAVHIHVAADNTSSIIAITRTSVQISN